MRIFLSGFGRSLRYLMGAAGLKLVNRRRTSDAIGRRMSWSFDQCRDKPIHYDFWLIRMKLEEIGPVAALGRNFADIERFVPQPRRLVGGGLVDRLFARTRRDVVQQLHR